MGCSLKWNTDLVCKSFFEMIFLSVILLFIFFFWACRLRRRRPVPSPRPGVVCPQSHKKSFLRSLFCGSGTSPPDLAGFPPTTSRCGDGNQNPKNKKIKLFGFIKTNTIFVILFIKTNKYFKPTNIGFYL